MKTNLIIFLILTLAANILIYDYGVDGERILLLPVPAYSHVAGQVLIGQQLVQMGNEVSLAIGKDFLLTKTQPEKKGIAVIRHNESTHKDALQIHGREFDEMIVNYTFNDISPFEFIKELSNRMVHNCDSMFSDKEFRSKIENQKFDLILVDGIAFARCFAILPHLLNVRFVTESPIYEGWLAGASTPTSVVPSFLLAFTPKMNLLERLLNFVVHVQFNRLSFPLGGEWLLEKFLPGGKLSFRELAAKSDFWLFGNMDPHIDYTLPTTTNMAFVGGLTTTPANSLPSELETFVSGADMGIVVMSFGSIASYIPDYIFDKFFAAFAQLKQVRFVVRAPDGYSNSLSSNVKLMTWLPQNDLVGHHKTKLFITHCGSNGQFEALYHGKPMLGVPIMPSDQQYNANRIKFKGFGLTLHLRDSTTHEILEAITELLNNSSYSDNIKKASIAFKSTTLSPVQRAGHLIDYVSKHSGIHLRPLAADMPLWEVYMVDVFFIVVSVLVMFVFTICLVLRFLFKKMFGFNEREVKKLDANANQNVGLTSNKKFL